MSTDFKIKVILHSGVESIFEDIVYGKDYFRQSNGIKLKVSADFPPKVTSTPPSIDDPVKSIEYNIYTDIRNYHKQIIPDTGRDYSDIMSMSKFFPFKDCSSINNVRMPIHIFTGLDRNMALAFGVIGENYETEFSAIEPEVRRALIVYMRRLSIQIKRGTAQYPIPDSVAKKNSDGSITERLFYRTENDSPAQPWLLTLREFAGFQKEIYKLPDLTTEPSMYPLWCSWTDWFSDDVTDEVILNNAKEGVKLGIKNYIIDDGWFGPGLDNDFDVTIDMGDWEPDPAKIKDMGKLVQQLKAVGAVPLIWCAPHAVAPAAKCFPERKPYLIMDDKRKLLMTHNGFHSLCFMCPEAREIMADICAGFIEKWDFEGAKYDLFNCIANIKCENPDHNHDVTSMIEGLHQTLELINTKTKKLKSNYIVELKQNYGTPFLARHGTMMRAGDTPYNSEGNFMRTLYVQGYSPYAINDYQTITSEDSPEDAACIILKMIAVGIPTYSIDFFRLNQDNKAVITHYNNWYNEHLNMFHNYRIPLDAENNILKISDRARDCFFLVNNGGNIEVERSSTVLNGTYNRDLFLRAEKNIVAKFSMFDCSGNKVETKQIELNTWKHFAILPGSRIEIDCLNITPVD